MFQILAPYYLSIGMTLEEYWRGDPALALTYFRSELIRGRAKQRELWYHGLYVRQAVASCFSEEAAYFEAPLPDNREDAQRQEKQKQAAAQAIIEARFLAWGNS